MHIVFGWGANPSTEDLKYRVSSYNFSVGNEEGDNRPANCVPGILTLEIEAPPTASPAQQFLKFAAKQHSSAKDEGAGKLVMYKGEDVGEAILEISFKQGWISNIHMGNRRGDKVIPVTLVISAAEVTVSGVTFTHSSRREAVTA